MHEKSENSNNYNKCMLLLSIAAWYVSASVSVIASKSALNAAAASSSSSSRNTAAAVVDLSLAQFAFGCLPLVFTWLREVVFAGGSEKEEASKDKKHGTTNHYSAHVVAAGVCHFVGTVATCVSFAEVSAGLTQVIKLLEPIFVALLAWALLGKEIAATTAVAIVLIILGVALATINDTSFNAVGVSAALISAISFSLRNVLSMYQRKSPSSSSSSPSSPSSSSSSSSNDSVSYEHVSAVSMVFFGLPLLAVKYLRGTGAQDVFASQLPLVPVLVASSSHLVYNYASYLCLFILGPITHSLANVFKRFVIIASADVYFGEGLDIYHFLGYALAAVGLAIYNKASTRTLVASVILCTLAVAGVVWTENATSHNHQHHAYDAVAPAAATGAAAAAADFARQGIVIWTHGSFSASQKQTIAAAASSLTRLDMYCLAASCYTEFKDLAARQPPTVAIHRPFKAYELCKDTPLLQWFRLHARNKALAGRPYLAHSTIALQLCALYHRGGAIVGLSSTGILTPACGNSINGCIGVTSEGVFVLSSAVQPLNSAFTKALMAAFVEGYPTRLPAGSQWPLRLDIDKAVTDALRKTPFGTCLESSSDNVKSKTTKPKAKSPPFCPDLIPLPQGASGSLIAQVPSNEHYGYYSYDRYSKNVGDYVQSLTGNQYLPFADRVVGRNDLGNHREAPEDTMTIVANGWYGNMTEYQWPLQSNIRPLLFAIFVGAWKIEDPVIDYLKKMAPIGARDLYTLDKMERMKQIPAFFSGCATLLLRNPNEPQARTNNIIIVEADYSDVIPEPIRRQARHMTHSLGYDNGRTDHLGDDVINPISTAISYLQIYATAKLVITSRIHVALPCVAFGTPVIFIYSDMIDDVVNSAKWKYTRRLAGLTQFFHRIDVPSKDQKDAAKRFFANFEYNSPPPNPNVHQIDRFRATFWNIIRRHNGLVHESLLLDLMPTKRLGALAPPLTPLRFYVILETFASRPSSPSDGSDVAKRSLESIFYHHPNAEVHLLVHTAEEGKGVQDRFATFLEGGYQLQVEVMDVQDITRKAVSNSAVAKQISAALQGKKKQFNPLLGLMLLLQQRDSASVFCQSDVIFQRPLYDVLFNLEAAQSLPMLNTNLALLGTSRLDGLLSEIIAAISSSSSQALTDQNIADIITDISNKKTQKATQADKEFEKKTKSLLSLRQHCPNGDEIKSVDQIKTQVAVAVSKQSKDLSGEICNYILSQFCVFCNEYPLKPAKNYIYDR